MKYYIIILGLLTIITSCVAKKEIVYFYNGEINEDMIKNTTEVIYKTGDQLQINVSALNFEAAKPFNLSTVTYNDKAPGTSQGGLQSYIIDENGEIDFPIIGKLKLAGLNKNNAIEHIKSKLSPNYILNPTVTVKIINFSITILGAVKKPGTFTINDERISILEAIGLAGDINISGKRIIKVYREEQNNEKKVYEVDLRSNDIFSSPVYYLQQNDVVYVEPNRAISQNASYNKNTGLFISLASVFISLISILTR